MMISKRINIFKEAWRHHRVKFHLDNAMTNMSERRKITKFTKLWEDSKCLSMVKESLRNMLRLWSLMAIHSRSTHSKTLKKLEPTYLRPSLRQWKRLQLNLSPQFFRLNHLVMIISQSRQLKETHLESLPWHLENTQKLWKHQWSVLINSFMLSVTMTKLTTKCLSILQYLL